MLVTPVLVQGLEQRAAAVYKLRLQWKIFKSWQYYCLFMATGVSASHRSECTCELPYLSTICNFPDVVRWTQDCLLTLGRYHYLLCVFLFAEAESGGHDEAEE